MRCKTENADLRHIVPRENHGSVCWILRPQGNAVLKIPNALQSCAVLPDLYRCDLTVLHLWLLLDADDIAITNAGVDHTVTLAHQREIAVYEVRDGIVAFNVLLCQNRLTAGDAADRFDFH